MTPGPVISSYAVSDRTQVADVDPSMVIDEDDEEDEEQPCPICGYDDNEDKLLQCDGCDGYYHTYCIGLDEVPVGHFFCEECQTQRAIEASCPTGSTGPNGSTPTTHHTRATRRPHRTADIRTRGQQRRISTRNQASSSNWARVWQSVWDHLNLDLDFPFDDAAESARIDRAQRAPSQRTGLRQWERRLHVAETQGGVNRFRDTASTLLNVHAVPERPEAAPAESREEIRAWNAFEKAKEIELDPAPKRKRKSATNSPSDAEPVVQPQRPLKRPRTRRTVDHTEASSSTAAAAAASRSRRDSAIGPSSSRNPVANHAATQSNGPSFLQSMLREIETSSAPDETKGSSRHSMQSATNHSSPQPSSPGASPMSSNHGTPRARSTTPPPSLCTRPGSPLGLTSKVEPIFPPPEFSPTRSPADLSLTYRPPHDSQKIPQERRTSRPRQQQGSSPPRSKDSSPARANMPLSLKSDLQKMVTAALKPYYHSNNVSKDQYTDINRNISHMLYDKVGEKGTVNDETREAWERLASDEVAKAVQSLKATT